MGFFGNVQSVASLASRARGLGLPQHFEHVAFLVNCSPVFIGLGRFNLYGLVAKAAHWELRLENKVKDPWHWNGLLM